MTVRNDDIDRRLEFLKIDYKRELPPITAMSENRPSRGAPLRGNFGRRNSYLKLRMISPSKQNRQLMRQVSGLGMEDPVFGTVEDGPSHPSNFFDDMSLGDVPEDMRDLVSIASDPTAEGGIGLDVNMYQSNLGNFNQSTSDYNMMELSLPQHLASVNLLREKITSAMARKSEKASDGTSDVNFQRESSYLTVPLLLEDDEDADVTAPASTDGPREIVLSPLTSFKTTGSKRTSNPSHQLIEKLNASVQSLSLEDALIGIPSPPHSPRRALDGSKRSMASGSSKSSRHTSTSKGTATLSLTQKAQRLVSPRKATMTTQTATNKNETRNARAPQRQGSLSNVVVGSTLSRSAQEFQIFSPPQMMVEKTMLHRGDSIYQPAAPVPPAVEAKRGSLSSSLVVVQPENLHVPPSQPGASQDFPLVKSRAMPNITTIFPVEAPMKRSRPRRSKISTVPSTVSKEEAEAKIRANRRQSAGYGDNISVITTFSETDETNNRSLDAVRASIATNDGLSF